MSIAVAIKLYEIVQQPRAELVGRKRPQGPPTREAMERLMQHQSGNPETKPTVNPTIEYWGHFFYAGIILERYVGGGPGATLFVLPGSARRLAEEVVETLPLGSTGVRRRAELVKSLTEYFEFGERPLRTELGKELIPRLFVLRTVTMLEAAAEINDADPDGGDVLGIFDIMEKVVPALISADARRSEADPPKRATPRKRKPVLRRTKGLRK